MAKRKQEAEVAEALNENPNQQADKSVDEATEEATERAADAPMAFPESREMNAEQEAEARDENNTDVREPARSDASPARALADQQKFVGKDQFRVFDVRLRDKTREDVRAEAHESGFLEAPNNPVAVNDPIDPRVPSSSPALRAEVGVDLYLCPECDGVLMPDEPMPGRPKLTCPECGFMTQPERAARHLVRVGSEEEFRAQLGGSKFAGHTQMRQDRLEELFDSALPLDAHRNTRVK
jgi:hypothetical protein